MLMKEPEDGRSIRMPDLQVTVGIDDNLDSVPSQGMFHRIGGFKDLVELL